jgi:ABC-type multidrug transport system ATPase subunit/pSer/pThr/pTyr-binding forkhead associated (FHA) protein
MPLIIQWTGGELLLDETKTAIVGRSDSVEITIKHQKISRHHLVFSFENGDWTARDLDTPNGSFLNAKRITEQVLPKSASITLGGPVGPTLSVSVLERLRPQEVTAAVASGARQKAQVRGGRFNLSGRVRIGRDSSNDLVLDDLDVSRFHCEITTNDGQTHEIVDLGSGNGTFVEGAKIKRRRLKVGDVVSIGGHTFTYSGGSLENSATESGPSLVIDGVSVHIGNARLLSDVSFELRPSSLTGVIGPSGAGKSTLLSVLTGELAPTSGVITFGGRDLIQNFEELRSRLGFVPQSDLLHTNLTVRSALRFGADLRFSPDVTPGEKAQRVESVMSDLGLSKRADLRIDKLSGGQRKRTSVALELLTEPMVLMLDEPTSGLDPGLDRQVMQLLRTLADEGRTVLVVTHSTANLDLCDDVLVMAPGGEVAYFGSPLTVLNALESRDWSEAFDSISERGTTGTKKRQVDPRAQNHHELPRPNRRQPWAYQLLVLIRRYRAVIFADKPYLTFLLALPVVLALVGYIVGDELGLGEGEESDFGLNLQARSVLLIVILAAAFMGAASSIQELVKERSIFHRERSTGLSASAYITSKILVLGALVVAQSVFFTLFTLLGRPMPDRGLVFESSTLELVMTVALLAFTGVLLGLLVSNFAKTPEIALPALVVITMLQVVLSGAVPLRFDALAETLGTVNPAYWAMNAMGATVDLNALMGYSGSDEVLGWEATVSNWNFSLGVMAFYAFVLTALVLVLGQTKRAQ